MDTAKVIAEVIQSVCAAIILPLIASYFNESTVPAFAIFLACSYV